MLVITRKEGETVVLGGQIEVTVVSVDGNQVRLGFKAPSHVLIHRKELFERIQQTNREAIVNKETTRLPRISIPPAEKVKQGGDGG